MITVTVYKESGKYKGFDCAGHAGYAQEGYDIICSAVSVLTVNTVNSIERFTEDKFSCSSKDGFVGLKLDGAVSDKTALLLDSMILGLQDIQENYGNKYIRLMFKEV